MSKVTLSTLRKLKQAGEKFASLTAYDAGFARLMDQAGVDVILVGDSLGMVVQGRETTLPVTMGEMVYHTRCVCRGSERALVMSDMPFMSYATPAQALDNAARLMKEGGAHCVKLEVHGGMVETVRLLASYGIPVCAHLGLLPQTVHKLGGYKVQGRDEAAAAEMIAAAQAMVDAGADILVLECVPSALGRAITAAVEAPVIGIGAGADTDGQVLVLHDMLGVTPGKRPKFSHDFLQATGTVQAAFAAYAAAVKERRFPTAAHTVD